MKKEIVCVGVCVKEKESVCTNKRERERESEIRRPSIFIIGGDWKTLSAEIIP